MKSSLKKLAAVACLGSSLCLTIQCAFADDEVQAQSDSHDVQADNHNVELDPALLKMIVRHCCETMMEEVQKCPCNRPSAPAPQPQPAPTEEVSKKPRERNCRNEDLEAIQNLLEVAAEDVEAEEVVSKSLIESCCTMVMDAVQQLTQYYKCPCNRPSAPAPQPQPETPSKSLLKKCCRTMLQEAMMSDDMMLVEHVADMMKEMEAMKDC